MPLKFFERALCYLAPGVCLLAQTPPPPMGPGEPVTLA